MNRPTATISKSEQYISDLIAQGEHEQLDFKFEISDSKKIARTLSAFSNTNGGRLLVGVKDNGKIAGVRSDEEFYMLEAAAKIYCKPPVNFSCTEWRVFNKMVLEVVIEPSLNKPHMAPDKGGDLKAYIRVGDQNLLANSVLINVWKRQREWVDTFIPLTGPSKILLDYLNINDTITKSKFCKLAKINSYYADKVLINLVAAGVISMEFTEKAVFYKLLPNSA